MKFIWLAVFIFKKSLSKVNNVAIFSIGGSSKEGGILYCIKKTCIITLTHLLTEYFILYKSEINFYKIFIIVNTNVLIRLNTTAVRKRP